MRAPILKLCLCSALTIIGCGDQEATNPLLPPSQDDTTDSFRTRPDTLSGVTATDAADGDITANSDVALNDIFSDVQPLNDANTLDTTSADIAATDATDAADAADTFDTPLPPGPLARGITLNRVDLYQTIRLSWMIDRQSAPSTAPLITGRATLVRVFVTPQASWTPQQVTARVLVEGAWGARAFVVTQIVTASSTEGLTTSTLNVRLPPEVITPDARASVMLITPPNVDGDLPPDGAQHLAAWPSVGQLTALGARSDSGPLKVTFVPFRYDTDGSGRLPDTSPAQLARYDAVLRALYPATDIQVTVHSPIPWTTSVRFGSFNQALVQLREDERAPDDVYYYGLIQSADTFSAYCGGSCTTGQSYTVSDSADGTYRVGSGVGFGSEDSAWTLAHELGHMHGRGHAPCGVSFWSADSGYPHSGGDIGIWGWDMRDDSFKAPGDWTDLMGYCDDLWLSDYTYQGLYARAAEVFAAFGQLSPFPTRSPYRFLTLSPSAPPEWGAHVSLSRVHTGQWRIARALDATGHLIEERAVPAIATGDAGDLDLLIPQHLIAPPCAVLTVEGARDPIVP